MFNTKSCRISLLLFALAINLLFVGAQQFTCPPTPGEPLLIETSSATIPITITSDPLTCSVTVRNLNAPSITFLGSIDDPSVSITVDGVTCTGSEDICVQFPNNINSFDTISINGVSSIYDNSLASSVAQEAVNNVQLVAFLGNFTSNGSAITISNCNFNAVVIKTSTSPDLRFGLLLVNGLASFIRNGITVRDSNFVARINDASAGEVTRSSLRFAAGIDSTDLYLHRLNLINNNSQGCDGGLSFFHIIVGSMRGRSGLSFKNVFARTLNFFTTSYTSSSFLFVAFGSSKPPFFDFENIDYRIELAAGGQTETYFLSAASVEFDFQNVVGVSFRNVQWIVRNENLRSWATNVLLWHGSYTNAKFVVLDNFTWDAVVATVDYIGDEDMMTVDQLTSPSFNLTNSNIRLNFSDSGGTGRRNLLTFGPEGPQTLFLINNTITIIIQKKGGMTVEVDNRAGFSSIFVENVTFTVSLDTRTSPNADPNSVRFLGRYGWRSVEHSTDLTVRDVKMNVTMMLAPAQSADVALFDGSQITYNPVTCTTADCPVVLFENIDISFTTGSVARPWEFDAADVSKDAFAAAPEVIMDPACFPSPSAASR